MTNPQHPVDREGLVEARGRLMQIVEGASPTQAYKQDFASYAYNQMRRDLAVVLDLITAQAAELEEVRKELARTNLA